MGYQNHVNMLLTSPAIYCLHHPLNKSTKIRIFVIAMDWGFGEGIDFREARRNFLRKYSRS